MSNNDDNKSLSGSSSDSQKNQPLMFRDNNSDSIDLTLYGSSASILSRTGTVRRANSSINTTRKEKELDDIKTNEQDDLKVVQSSPDLQQIPDRYRKSLDSTYRHSLESISEYKPKISFSTSTTLYPSRGYSSLESSSSDCTLSDIAVRSSTELTNQRGDGDNSDNGGGADNEKTIISSASSYLSWIESVHSEFFGINSQQTPTTISDNLPVDVDGKVGEWNNFWLNYSNSRNRYLSTTTNDLSDIRSTTSTQKDIIDKNSLEQIYLSMDEINEILNCSKRIIEILEKSLHRDDPEFDDSKNESFYSQPYSRHTSIKDEPIIAPRERSFSYAIGTQDPQKTKLASKSAPQSSSSSCINAILATTGVSDILKKVMAKRRDFTTNITSTTGGINSDEVPRFTRASFSDWTFGRQNFDN